MKKISLVILLSAAAFVARAQQDVLLSQYMFNHLLINPAYAGSKDYMTATLLYRNQWTGWKDAPKTQVASLQSPLGVTNLGWGGLISHDHEGVTDRTDFYANAAYHVKVNEKLKLGMGIRGGAAYFVQKNSDLLVWDNTDPDFLGDNVSNLLPNFGAGLYLYSTKFYTGLSVPELLSYDPAKALSLGGTKIVPRQVQHYFYTIGAVLPLNADVIVRPSLLVKYTGNTPLETDINVNFLFANTFWIGGSYRTNDAIVAIVEYQVTKNLRFGYSYDMATTDIKSYSSASHEIMLGYDFGRDIKKIEMPRYF